MPKPKKNQHPLAREGASQRVKQRWWLESRKRIEAEGGAVSVASTRFRDEDLMEYFGLDARLRGEEN